jgi:predicted nucleic acid-binding protein
MLVVDASRVVDYLLDDGSRGIWSAERIVAADGLHAPHLLDLEVLAGINLRRASPGGNPRPRGSAREALSGRSVLVATSRGSRASSEPTGMIAANFFYLTMTFYYFYAFVALALALALPVVFARP